jgi:hypothetical protein
MPIRWVQPQQTMKAAKSTNSQGKGSSRRRIANVSSAAGMAK